VLGPAPPQGEGLILLPTLVLGIALKWQQHLHRWSSPPKLWFCVPNQNICTKQRSAKLILHYYSIPHAWTKSRSVSPSLYHFLGLMWPLTKRPHSENVKNVKVLLVWVLVHPSLTVLSKCNNREDPGKRNHHL